MSEETFHALLLDKTDDGPEAHFTDLPVSDLPDGDLLIDVAYSSLNYKDGLAVTGSAPIARHYPMIPGIDLAGTVLESASPDFQPGDAILVVGCELGEKYWGGYATRARVQADWAVPLPEGLTLAQAMGIGTAGFTAMLSVMALQEHGVRPEDGPIAITGASGGVGSMSIAILGALGYEVTAFTGRTHLADYLTDLGARRVVDRAEIAAPRRPLDKGQWAGAIDSVGGEPLAALLSQMQPGGSVAACGLAASHELPTTVYPFILRGVNLLGIYSVTMPAARRRAVWQRIAQDLPTDRLDAIMRIEPLSDIFTLAQAIMAGQIQGRVAIDVTA